LLKKHALCITNVIIFSYNLGMLKLFILLCLLLFSGQANDSKSTSIVPYEKSIVSLKSIEKNAIIYGSGEKTVYVFLDPICPYSRKFLSMISKNEKMLSKYRYCIYLYRIPRLHSTKFVAAIYDSKQPLDTLLDIMLKDSKISSKTNKKIEEKIDTIEAVAKKLNVNKRPYLIVQK